MIGWLPAIAMYWTLAALYLGGAALRFEGGGGGRHVGGLLLHFAVFLVVFGAARAVFQAIFPIPLAVGLGLVTAAIFLPVTAKLVFRVVGVRITGSVPAGGEASV